MTVLQSFPPISTPDAKVLILGSMPGKKSLQAQQYYAHPQNQFWPIMAKLFDFPVDCSYQERVNHLILQKIAVWDVLQHCKRQSSLDSDIEKDSIVPNDFQHFLARHASVNTIFFNGKKSEEIFHKHVIKNLHDRSDLQLQAMPSTSPANAAISKKEKFRRWSILLDYLG